MKKFKFIPVLAVAALLSACGASKATVSVKAPKFAKEGKEVEVAKFSEDAVAALNGVEYLNDEAKIGSKEIKAKNTAAQTATYSHDKKEQMKQEVKQCEEVVAQFDMKNNVLKATNKNSRSTLFKLPYGFSEEYVEEIETIYIQEAQHEGEAWAVSANVESKEATLMGKTSTTSIETVLQLSVRGCVEEYFSLSSMSTFLQAMPSMTEEQLEGYKFYENGSVYTVSYVAEQTSENKNSDDEVVATMTTKTTNKVQFEIKEGSIVYRLATETLITTTYLKETSGYSEGDVIENKTVQYSEVSAKDYKKSVKALDLKDYDFLAI